MGWGPVLLSMEVTLNVVDGAALWKWCCRLSWV